MSPYLVKAIGNQWWLVHFTANGDISCVHTRLSSKSTCL